MANRQIKGRRRGNEAERSPEIPSPFRLPMNGFIRCCRSLVRDLRIMRRPKEAAKAQTEYRSADILVRLRNSREKAPTRMSALQVHWLHAPPPRGWDSPYVDAYCPSRAFGGPLTRQGIGYSWSNRSFFRQGINVAIRWCPKTSRNWGKARWYCSRKRYSAPRNNIPTSAR